MGSLAISCGVMEKAGSCCGWVPAPLMTVRASKTGIDEGHPQRFIAELGKRTGLGMRPRESKMLMAGMCGALLFPRRGLRG